jgi:hypothetical protein
MLENSHSGACIGRQVKFGGLAPRKLADRPIALSDTGIIWGDLAPKPLISAAYEDNTIKYICIAP